MKPTDLRLLVKKLGGRFVVIKPADQQEAARKIRKIRLALPISSRLQELRCELGPTSTPKARYEIEYQNSLYQSYKPGIDDLEIENLLDARLVEIETCLEIGGGLAYICELVKKTNPSAMTWSIDLASHPRLRTVGVRYLLGDITTSRTRRDCQRLLSKHQDGNILIVLSYCLDRVANQERALQNFAGMIRGCKGMAVGLITVCLPAISSSPGIAGLSYASDKGWVTHGVDPLEDYELIVRSCGGKGLRLTCGGLTHHYGVSLDGFEDLPCYCMVMKRR